MRSLARRKFLAGIGFFLSDLAVPRSFAGVPAIGQLPPSGSRQSEPGTSASGLVHPTHWFTDISSKSSFTYRTNNDFTGRKYFPQPMCGGVAVLDYNNDGWMDLFFTNGAKLPDLRKTSPAFYNCLLRNNGNGTFTDVT